MKLGYITIMVRDVEKTVDFYKKTAELEVVRRFNPGMGEIVFMSDEEGGTMLEFIEFDEAEKVDAKGMVMSYSCSTDLQEKHSQLKSMGMNPSEIMDMPPKPKHFTIVDPDGLCVEITEHH